ncbi:DUF3419 family protein [Candidatus Uabimicrobium sp. HlEnr_7]|uniref:DUF3419 family protein n=1 Tax=Candidatus Uabimicrobium helgolandensis TaxID=3095367 RepID=UPI003555C087
MDLSILRYSNVWEDLELLYGGLQIEDTDNILSITSSGDNVLGLLLKKPNSITAIDLSPTQNHLLELKIAAIKELEHEEFLNILGINDCSDRMKLFSKIESSLSPEACSFWRENFTLIELGIVFQGKLEKHFFKLVEEIKRQNWDAKIEKFLHLSDIKEQEQEFKRVFNEDFAKFFENLFCAESLSKGRDEEKYKYVTIDDTGKQFFQRFRNCCCSCPAQENFYLHWLLLRKYIHDLPHYLRQENFDILKKQIHKVKVVTAELNEFLKKQSKNSISKANLSNLFEYLSLEQTNDIFMELSRVMSPGGISAHWNLFVERTFPKDLTLFKRMPKSKELFEKDRIGWAYGDFHLVEYLS